MVGPRRFLCVLCASAVNLFLITSTSAQIVTPRGKVAVIYREPNVESSIVAEVEPNGRWRLEFTGAEIPARLPSESSSLALKFLLPARDTGLAVLARVRGPGKGNEGWVEVEKVEVSPDPAWKIPADTLLFVPMKARQVPPLRVAPLGASIAARRCSYLLLVDPEGKVAGVRPLESAKDPALESALHLFRFAPMRVEGEPVHVLLAIRAEPRPQGKP